MTIFILFFLWSVVMVFCGYHLGLSEKTILINSLSFRQAVRWIFIHEKRRHQSDIDAINHDLASLRDVKLPQEADDLAGKIHFKL